MRLSQSDDAIVARLSRETCDIPEIKGTAPVAVPFLFPSKPRCSRENRLTLQPFFSSFLEDFFMLTISNATKLLGGRALFSEASFQANPGDRIGLVGPNGSGKSTLAYSIAGHPKYEVTEGEILLDGQNVLEMAVDERAKAGLFLAMQYPVEVPGVSVSNFLRTAKTALDGEAPKLREWIGDLKHAMKNLRMDPDFTERNVNEGFSGGEKKRHEILQLELEFLEQELAVEQNLALHRTRFRSRFRGWKSCRAGWPRTS